MGPEAFSFPGRLISTFLGKEDLLLRGNKGTSPPIVPDEIVCTRATSEEAAYRGNWLIRNTPPVGPYYRSTGPGLRGEGCFS